MKCSCVKEDGVTLGRLVDVLDLAERYRKGVATIRYWMVQGRLPQPDRHIGNGRFWREGVIAEWERKETARCRRLEAQRRKTAAHMRACRKARTGQVGGGKDAESRQE